MLAGIIFDLDGTLVDSGLDFDAMRREMRLPAGTPILEALEEMSPQEARRCRGILERHEQQGAQRARPLPGVEQLLAWVVQRGWRRAIVTRNSKPATLAMLDKLGLPFDPVLTREDGPVKPRPWAILQVCQQWQAHPHQVVVIGDYLFDIQAGLRAGARTVLVAGNRQPAALPWSDEADLVLDSLEALEPLQHWLQSLG